jgi:hypothetical protein
LLQLLTDGKGVAARDGASSGDSAKGQAAVDYHGMRGATGERRRDTDEISRAGIRDLGTLGKVKLRAGDLVRPHQGVGGVNSQSLDGCWSIEQEQANHKPPNRQ